MMTLVSILLIALLNAVGKQVNIVVDGRSISVYTYQNSVQKVLVEAGIQLSEKDRVTPALNAKIKEKQQIKIVRIKEKQIAIEEKVPFNVVRHNDYTLPQGVERVIQPGINGVKRLIYLRILEDGVEVARKLLKTETISKPQDKIIAVGRRSTAVPVSRGEYEVRSDGPVITAVATAYTYTGNNTAAGVSPHRGVIAVDPKVIPLGTKVYVEGYGEAVALDTGASIKGNRIDVFFPSREECVRWGRRSVQVQIIGK